MNVSAARPRADAVLSRVAALFPGKYDNRDQHAADTAMGAASPHGFLAASVEPIDAPAFSPCVFAVRGYVDWARPAYMTRVYAFHDEPGGRAPVRLAVHYFDDRPERLEDSRGLTPAQGLHYPGCDLGVSLRGGVVVCVADPATSVKPVGDVPDAIERYTLTFDGPLMHVYRAAFAPSGRQLAGRPDKVPYKLCRIPA